MKVNSLDFIPVARAAINNPDLQAAVRLGTGNAYRGRIARMTAYGHEHGEAIRRQAAEAKRRVLRKLPDLLEQAEANLQANGVNVQWAADADEVNRLVLEIARRHNVQTVVKSKSMVSEEVGANAALEGAGIRVVETDLGEFIVQLSDSRPSHIVAPVIDRTKASIRDLFVEKLGMTPTDDAGEMTAFARQHLREIFLEADMGISGGNFIIAETGTVGLVTNEGNGRMVTTVPRVHVALVGIEKIVETVEDYGTLLQVLARSAAGQQMPVYAHLINGPRRDDEHDGPEHVYVILVDNGRSDIYQSETYTESLACIRCGACINACPVYQAVGGHAYGWVYSGPIGSVITPLLTGKENAAPLPYASTLCGACQEACPVQIDLPRMLLALRHDLIDSGESDLAWTVGIKAWAAVASSPTLFTLSGAAASRGQGIMPNNLPGPLGGWTQYRDVPAFAPKPFRQLWKERQQTRKNENHDRT